MSYLHWVADGIEVAERAGGVTLDRRRRPGFTGRDEITRRPTGDLYVSGFEIEADPDPFEDDE